AGSTKGIVKLDWNINDNHRMALIYNFLDASKDKPAHPTALGFRGPNASILQFENSGYQINNKLNSVQMELNSTLSSAVSNKLQFGYSHFDDFRNPMSSPAPAMTIQDGAGANYIIVGHEPFSINNRLDQKVIQLTNNLTYVKGDHTYTLGFSYEKFEFDNSFNLGVYGYGDDRGYAGAFGSFASVSDFTDAINNGLIQDAISAAEATYKNDSWSLAETNVGQMSFYLQDEWFVNDKFKLTYGLRMDKPLYFDSSDRAQDVIDSSSDYAPGTRYVNPNKPNKLPGFQLLDNTKMPSDKWVISPRLGFNYDVNGNDTTQIRGGSGLFTGRFPFVWLGNQIGNPNWWFHQMVDPDYQFPQVWRTNLGIDQEYDNGLTLSLDVSYTKDINGPQVQNWGFKTPSGTLSGVDNRAVYTANDFVQVDVGFPVNASAYVFSNSDLGRIWNYSLKLQKSFDSGLYASLAYNHLNAKDVNSIEAEITGDAFDFNPVVGDANAENLSYSKYGDMHRIVGVASQSWNYGTNNRWGSTITTFFEYNRGGRYSYTYAGDINGDGRGGNDLLYVPTPSQISQMNFANPADASAYNAFIEQDEYLKSRRGKYAERYGALSPWVSRWDVRFLQDYRIQRSSGKTNVIQFSMDILNFGNLISSDWGLVQQPNSIQPVGVTVTNGVPSYTFDSNLVDSFVYDSSLQSRWQLQFGLRYIF
ncbi:MAG: TonB-dependent receptor domain-containing protein, partial [Flavobacteriaceae bacterium]